MEECARRKGAKGEARREGTRRKKNGVATKAPLRMAYEGSMHPSPGCTALASARVHRVCISVCNPARFHPRQPLFLRAPLFPRSLSLSRSFSASSSLIFFLSPSSSLEILVLSPAYRAVSFRHILRSDFSPFSATCIPRVPLFSSYLPCSAHRRSSFTSHTYPRPKDPPRLVPFRTFTFAVAKLHTIL